MGFMKSLHWLKTKEWSHFRWIKTIHQKIQTNAKSVSIQKKMEHLLSYLVVTLWHVSSAVKRFWEIHVQFVGVWSINTSEFTCEEKQSRLAYAKSFIALAFCVNTFVHILLHPLSSFSTSMIFKSFYFHYRAKMTSSTFQQIHCASKNSQKSKVKHPSVKLLQH